ncbi:MAG TPA: hypothetical protein PKX79_03980 [Spirochaetota bacterium]|nr:hypothetical protein [Spirochaetota bacterium]
MNSFTLAKDTLLKSYTEVPQELRGVWYSVTYSEDKGVNTNYTKRPLCSVTRTIISTAYSSLVITAVDKHKIKGDLVYAIFTEDPTRKFLIVCSGGDIRVPILYGMENDEETFRSLIDIKQ